MRKFFGLGQIQALLEDDHLFLPRSTSHGVNITIMAWPGEEFIGRGKSQEEPRRRKRRANYGFMRVRGKHG
jgi:hypothetical protein